ncbi:HEAT repeat domain-containing protein [Labrys neptuniae]
MYLALMSSAGSAKREPSELWPAYRIGGEKNPSRLGDSGKDVIIWRVLLPGYSGAALNDSRRLTFQSAENPSGPIFPQETSDLIERAVEHERQEDCSRNQALVILQARGSREVLEAAIMLCRSENPVRRNVGATILGQLGNPRSFPEECCDVLLELVRSNPELEVLRCALFSLGHLANPRCQPDLMRFANHTDPLVRYAVAFSFHAPQTEEAVQTLLRLMKEREEVRVRDWATRALGLSEADGEAIRDALLANAVDEDEIVRTEALQGLARRKDRRAVAYLIEELLTPTCHVDDFADAAKIYLGLNAEQEFDPAELIALLQAKRQ